MPKVSVLMPVYKTNEKYLREAIESILDQTFSDFEFLILDDCPDDDREEIVKSYKDKRIKYSKNEQNLGITPSRNKLIDMASGEYLAVFDHDDISLPDRLEKQVAYLDEHSDVGVVSCKVKTMIRGKTSRNPSNNHDIKLALMRVCSINHSAAMIRKSVLTENNIRYEEEFSPSEDYALWCRLIPFTNFHNLNEILFHYRDHGQNTSHRQSDKMRQATLSIWSFVKNDNPQLYEEFLFKAKHTTRIRLFGFIPFITIKKQANLTKVYLFKKLPLFASKSVIKLQEK
ncbi:MAG: glycosyltransferase [Alphaproteobacteria bacterium]|nr:glycosyltransferase [Alphaproteobacteria bacterium]